MVTHWSMIYPEHPDETWFLAPRPSEGHHIFATWPYFQDHPHTVGGILLYWFYKIPARNGHERQLAFRCTANVRTPYWSLVVGPVYIVTNDGELPDWGGMSLISTGPPCGNYIEDMWAGEWVRVRSQTTPFRAAIQGTPSIDFAQRAAIAKTGSINVATRAHIQDSPLLEVTTRAAIMGTPSIDIINRATIRGDTSLDSPIRAAVSVNPSIEVTQLAYIKGNPRQWYHVRAAIHGETSMSYAVRALIVNDRTDEIYLEMENLYPQENDLRSVRNAPTRTRDWRTEPLS